MFIVPNVIYNVNKIHNCNAINVPLDNNNSNIIISSDSNETSIRFHKKHNNINSKNQRQDNSKINRYGKV